MTDPQVLLMYRLLGLAARVAYFADQILYVRLCLRLMRTIVRYGNSIISTPGYSLYSMTLVALGEYRAADAFGRVALALAERYQA